MQVSVVTLLLVALLGGVVGLSLRSRRTVVWAAPSRSRWPGVLLVTSAMLGLLLSIVLLPWWPDGPLLQVPRSAQAEDPTSPNLLSTILVYFMLFGFIAFEAGAVSPAYRDRSTVKNLLVLVVSLASYLSVAHWCEVHSTPIARVFWAGFACTVSLIVANAVTERSSLATNVLIAGLSAGACFPLMESLVWSGVLSQLGFVDASGASAVHLLGAAISILLIATVGPRARKQRWRFLDQPDVQNFSSPWSAVGGLFLLFGWLGFNSGTAGSTQDHAVYNTIVGACGGGLAAAVFAGLIRSGGISATMQARLQAQPQMVIGMMGGLVAVTANGALQAVSPWMALVESLLGGLVAVNVSAWLTFRRHSQRLDDPLGVVGTHGAAAMVGLLATPLWLWLHDGILVPRLAVQLFGCSLCIVVAWAVFFLPIRLFLIIESIGLRSASSRVPPLRMRLSALEQLGTIRETPRDNWWYCRLRDARHRISDPLMAVDATWKRELCTFVASDVASDEQDRGAVARRVCNVLSESERHEDYAQFTVVAAAMLSLDTEEVLAGDGIRQALDLARRDRDRRNHREPTEGENLRAEALVWSLALLAQRAALASMEQVEFLAAAEEVEKFLHESLREENADSVLHAVQVGLIGLGGLWSQWGRPRPAPETSRAAFDPVAWAHRTHPGRYVVFDENFEAVIVTDTDPVDAMNDHRRRHPRPELILVVPPQEVSLRPPVARGGRE